MSIPARSRGSALARARGSYAAKHILLPVQKFIHTETSSGIVLLAAAAIALLWANSRWSVTYEHFWNLGALVGVGPFGLSHTLREWVNDALMVLFFFVVGIEVKREFVHGELSDRKRASLPVAAALGGMVVPAALYAVLNAGTPTQHGWGIPMATDIAFALGVLALLGDRVPAQLRIFLLALATVDDIGAILVIALFYSGQLSLGALVAAAALLLVMFGMWRIGIHRLMYYLPFATVFWFAVFSSGIHATIAGVVLGLMVPTSAQLSRRRYVDDAEPLMKNLKAAVHAGERERSDSILGQVEELTSGTESPADRLLRLLHPWSGYFVLPIFALANAGVTITAASAWKAFASPEARGVIVGLGVGKLIGIALFGYLAVKTRMASMLSGVRWSQMAGVALLGGIGFTVSLFITDLAFTNATNVNNAKAAVLLVSGLSGAAGYIFLRVTYRRLG